MPLKLGKSKKTIKSNIKELIGSKPSKSRARGIATLAKKRGISKKRAKAIQAVAISYSKSRNSKKKSKK